MAADQQGLEELPISELTREDASAIAVKRSTASVPGVAPAAAPAPPGAARLVPGTKIEIVKLLPPSDNGVQISSWDRKEGYALRVSEANAKGVRISYVTRKNGKEGYAHSYEPTEPVIPWRATVAALAPLVRDNSTVYQKEQQIATLRDLSIGLCVCKELPPGVDDQMRVSFEARGRSAFGEGRDAAWRPNALYEEQRALLAFAKAFVDRLCRKPATLFDLCVNVVTLADDFERPDEDVFARIQALLFFGTTLVADEADPEVVETFMRVVAFHAFAFPQAPEPRLLQAPEKRHPLRRLVSRLVNVASLKKDGIILLFNLFRAIAEELSARTQLKNTRPYRALTSTFQLLALDSDFRLFLNVSDLPRQAVDCAPALAALLLHEDPAVWEAVAHLVTNATVPGLFPAVIGCGELWSDEAPMCRLNDLRLRSIFARLLEFRRECDGDWRLSGACAGASAGPAAPRNDSEGVRLWTANFAALMRELSSRNVAHFLVQHVDEMALADAMCFRSFLADPGLGLSVMSSPRLSVRVVCSNALWAAFKLAARMIGPSERVVAIPPLSLQRAVGLVAASAPLPPSPSPSASGSASDSFYVLSPLSPASGRSASNAAAGHLASAGQAASADPVAIASDDDAFGPAGEIMGAFAMSVSNPIRDGVVLEAQLAELMSLVRVSPLFSSCIIRRFGDFAAGSDSAGRLIAVEDWLRDKLIPTFKEVRSAILALFPLQRDANADSASSDPLAFNSVGLECGSSSHVVEEKIRAIEFGMGPGSELTAAVWDYTAAYLSFGISGSSLGPDVATFTKELGVVLLSRLQQLEARTTLAPRIRALGHFMTAMMHFSRKHMMARVRKSVPTLERGVRLLQRIDGVAEEQQLAPYWCSSSIRSSSLLTSFSNAQLRAVEFIDASFDISKEKLVANVDDLPAYVSRTVAALGGRDAAGTDSATAALSTAVEVHVNYHIAQALAMMCLGEIKKVLGGQTDSAQIADVTTKLQAITDRNLDRIMFPLHEFASAFKERNEVILAGVQADAAQRAELEAAPLKQLNERTMLRYRKVFSAMDVPIAFLLANQLLAVQLITRVTRADLLVRLGTGQGKSIVLALSTIAECKAGRDKVFVFTSYDHLALRDHAVAKPAFQVEGLSSCVLTTDNSSLAGFASAKIVYANVMAIDGLVRRVVMKLHAGDVISESEAAFVSTMYGLRPLNFSVLLDEYDLLIDDMEGNQPFFMDMPPAVMTRDDVVRHQKFGPPGLSGEPLRKQIMEPAMDMAAGTSHFTLSGNYFRGDDGKPFYFLLPGVYRNGQFLTTAARVVGLSGSTSVEGTKLPGRADPPLAEMPASQDPATFETRIFPAELDNVSLLVGGSPAQLDGGSGIWCHRREVIQGGTDAASRGLVLMGCVERWCAAVCTDLAAIQAPAVPEAGAALQRRPVLIFVPPELAYVNGRGERTRVRDRLHQAIRECGAVSESNLVVAPADRDLTDAEIQRIGQAGYVTLAGIKLGRGVDIRVPIDIAGGLHVIVATEVVHRRLLKQMIGRTGRLGREGSYSIIVMDRIISPPERRGDEAWMGALHLASALGVHHLLSSQFSADDGEARRTWTCKWLLFLLGCSRKSSLGANCIDRAHFLHLLPAAATAGSAAATAIRGRLSTMLGGSPL